MTTFKRRQQVSYIQDLEHSVSVANAVANVAANVAAFIVEVAVKRRLLRRRMTNRGSVPEWTFWRRKRRSVRDIYNELGDVYFRRAYRMKYKTFKCLVTLLCPFIVAASRKKGSKSCISNGPISPDVRLACAIRWFAGGFTYGIMTTNGLGQHTDTINSYW